MAVAQGGRLASIPGFLLQLSGRKARRTETRCRALPAFDHTRRVAGSASSWATNFTAQDVKLGSLGVGRFAILGNLGKPLSATLRSKTNLRPEKTH